MKYKDPFLGEIELQKIGEDTRYAVGEFSTDTIYVDSRGNYYIHTSTTAVDYEIPIRVLRKSLIDKIIELTKTEEPTNEREN
jgi:hypothetical protein